MVSILMMVYVQIDPTVVGDHVYIHHAVVRVSKVFRKIGST